MADQFAIVTGASTGIGFELAHLAADNGYDLLIIADEPLIESAAADIRGKGVEVRAVEADLSTIDGVDRLLAAAEGRRIDLVCANAGTSMGGAFLDQPVEAWRRTIDTNITGTLYLLQRVLGDMAARNSGKVLVTGSIVGFLPGPFNSVYNGTKAFIDSFTDAIRDELRDKGGVTLTTLMPGATDTEFFDRAGMNDTAVGKAKKDDPAFVAKVGWDALMAGRGSVVSGWKNKLQVAAAHVIPAGVGAALHRHMAEPGSGAD